MGILEKIRHNGCKENDKQNAILKKKYEIKNCFEEIKDNNPDVFSVMCYFLEKNLIKIIIKRLDSDTGWGKDVRIKLYGIGEQESLSEIISLGSNDENIKKIEIYTQLDIMKKDVAVGGLSNINEIPLLYFPKNDYEDSYYSTFEYLQDYYSNLDIVYCDSIFQREYIISKKPSYLELFEKIANDNIQKQFFILVFIYEEGGIYVKDIESILPSKNNGKPLIDIYSGYNDNRGFIEKCDFVINNSSIDLIQILSYVCIQSAKNKSIQHYFDVLQDEINKKPGYYLFNNTFTFSDCKIIVHSKGGIYECEYLNEDYYMLSFTGKRYETVDEQDIKITIYKNSSNEDSSQKILSSVDILKEQFCIKENIYVIRIDDL